MIFRLRVTVVGVEEIEVFRIQLWFDVDNQETRQHESIVVNHQRGFEMIHCLLIRSAIQTSSTETRAVSSKNIAGVSIEINLRLKEINW